MQALRGLKKSKDFLSITSIIFLFFLLRLPSLFEPLWYGDEGIYQVIGTSLNHGKLLYSQVFDNKPPLLYWIYAILQSDQFSIRFASLIIGVFSVIMFFFLSKKLFANIKNDYSVFLATGIFAVLFALPTYEGNIANAENFMLLPVIAAAFLIVKQKKLFVAGLLLGIAFLIKIVAVFDLLAFLIYCFILNIDSLKKEFKLIPILIGFLLPLSCVSIFFIFNGTLLDFVKATLIANISYVNYGNRIGNFPFLLLIKVVLLGGFSLFMFIKRKKLNNAALFVLIWFAFSLFNTFFSQRPYTHYLLVFIPSFSLMIGSLLFDKKYQKTVILILLMSTFVVLREFGMPKVNKLINYYQNFALYLSDKKTLTSYQGFFDRNTPYDYEIARFIKPKLNSNDTVFVWGNNAQLYQLIGVTAPTKYVVAYHITNYKDGILSTQKVLEKSQPKFIVVMKNVGPIPFSLNDYASKINLNNAVIYEKLF